MFDCDTHIRSCEWWAGWAHACVVWERNDWSVPVWIQAHGGHAGSRRGADGCVCEVMHAWMVDWLTDSRNHPSRHVMPRFDWSRAAGEYVWGRYDMLVLPPSFPYGGMCISDCVHQLLWLRYSIVLLSSLIVMTALLNYFTECITCLTVFSNCHENEDLI